MIAKAIVKDGGLFIPNVEGIKSIFEQKEVQVQYEVLSTQNDEIFEKAAGLLKGKNIDPLKFQEEARNGWDK